MAGMHASDTRAVAAVSAPDATRSRILLAARVQCEEVGLRRATMEDVARRAGLGRATLYRYFPSKDALVRAIILAEEEAFFAALDGAVADYAGDEERLVEGFAFALQYARDHPLLAKLMRSEPESLLPYLVGGGELVRTATDAVCARIQGPQAGSSRGRDTAEILVRLVLSLVLTPESDLDVGARQGAMRFARRYLAAGLRE
jgi:AcrR family transcriptional regulator